MTLSKAGPGRWPHSRRSDEGAQDRARGGAGERRRRLSQNFFVAVQDASAFAHQLTVSVTHRVVELGSGSGQITRALTDVGHPVVALEIDPYWASRLERRHLRGVQVVTTDILGWRPAEVPAVLIGNLPFGIGTQILRHVLELGPQSLREGVFLLQREYVGKRVGRWGGNLFNAQWSPWYAFEEGLAFRREAFRPVPRADASTLLVRPRDEPVLSWSQRESYQSYVATVFDTGHRTIGEAARKAMGRSAKDVLTAARLSPLHVVKTLEAADWTALYVASCPTANRKPRPRPAGRDRPSRRL